VKIFFGTELIKLHPRQLPGGRSTDTNDYPVGKALDGRRDPEKSAHRAVGREVATDHGVS
jgi:hypothetical protein